MARGGVFRPPSVAAKALFGWAIEEWSWVNGTALLGGCHLGRLNGHDFYDALWALYMQWICIDSERHEAMKSAKRQFIALRVQVDTGAPTGIAATVGPRVNPKQLASQDGT